MKINQSLVEYHHAGMIFEGIAVSNEEVTRKLPAVLVFHGWEGRSEFQVEFATEMVRWGYVGFAVDLYGKGISPTTNDERQRLMVALMQDRQLMQDRLKRVLATVREMTGIDCTQIAAVGFCFGGLCALDLARTGEDVRAVASFHGVLKGTGLKRAVIGAKVIVFHGWDDPFAPPDDVVALAKELSESHADWQIHAYGNTMHAFTAEGVHYPEAGIAYNQTSANRARASLKTFLSEAFDKRVSPG